MEYNPSIDWKTGEIKMPKHTTETIKEYYVKNQRRKKETAIPIIVIDKLPRKEMSPRRCREEGQIASSPALHVKFNQREADENPNWRKKFTKRKEDKQEITIVHPEITTIFIKKSEDIAIIAQQLKDEIDMKLRKTSTTFPKPTIEEIVDEDSHKNHTQNPLPSDETILLEVKPIELENEEYLQSENIAEFWINKTN